MPNRLALGVVALTLFGPVVESAVAQVPARLPRPNIVVILADDK